MHTHWKFRAIKSFRLKHLALWNAFGTLPFDPVAETKSSNEIQLCVWPCECGFSHQAR